MFPQMVPISDLRRRSRDLLSMLSAGPVILMRRSRPAAVLVDFNEYQELMEAIQDARDREILAELRAEATEENLIPWEESETYRLAMEEEGRKRT
jgi:prevent-host-death family protein